MTSRKKIAAISKSAAKHHCAVLLKTGSPPGVMLCEGMEDGVKSWINDVKVCGSRMLLSPNNNEKKIHRYLSEREECMLIINAFRD
jgi:hypothetical protein